MSKRNPVNLSTKHKENIFVITGGPAVGKTTVLDALRKRGFKCFDEVARQVIEEQLSSGGKVVPWLDLSGFNKLVLEREVKRHADVSEELHFFDRGVPDQIGYLNSGGVEVHPEIHMAAKKRRYNKTVFFLEPWKEIYLNDSVRKEPFEYALKISEHIKNAYVELDYDVIVVPKGPVEERVDFILKEVKKKK
jgi:predicted ATPase